MSAVKQNKDLEGEKTSFEVAPLPIPAKDIKTTEKTEVVVLGAGVAGLTAALSAAEAGAKVILLEKAPKINYRGGWNAALESKIQKKAGIKVDKDKVIYTIMEWGAYRSNQSVVRLWADHCDEVMDWLIDMAESANIEVVLDPVTRDWYFPHYPVPHFFFSSPRDASFQKNLAELLEKNGKERGVDFRFETPAVRLLRKGHGRVTGVIAKNKNGDYIQFDASKAVVLCTGDYGSDKQMVEKYCSWQAVQLFDSNFAYSNMTTIATGLADGRVNTGDGHKMGMWIGAAIDDPPHCVMYFDRTGPVGSSAPAQPRSVVRTFMASFLTLARLPWLCVNKNGERFMNEDLPWSYDANQTIQQPGSFGWKVWDRKYDQEWPKFKEQACKNMAPPLHTYRPDYVAQKVAEGSVLTAQTIEELAQKMEVPVEAFKDTVARYNELARNGEDLDFGKHPDRMTTIEKPPFYACRYSQNYLVILGGLKINNRLQVLDIERNPIPGLYAAGNVSGSFWGNEYPTTVPGASHSRAWTFGRLAGLAATAEKV